MKIQSYIDHTLLKPEAKAEDILQLCGEAKEYQFVAVCVNPCWVEMCTKELTGAGVLVATVVGFPLGATTPEAKAFEARQAIESGAQEIDMVINVGALKSAQWELVERDIAAVVEVAGEQAIVKVILETGLLEQVELIQACQVSVEAGAHFVKTSTGFGPGGATVDHIRLMRKAVGSNVGVKASGGIRDRETALAMIEAGATRIGTSAGVWIVTGES